MLHALTLLAALCGDPRAMPTVTVEADGDMAVVVRGLRNADGHVLFVLHDKEKGFPGDDAGAVRTGQRTIKGSVAKLVWKDVPHGTYAIAVVHDENDNGDVDTNFIGMPKEGVGTSNNPRPRMGPPKWKDSKFVHDGQISTKVIKVVYL
jgi:uncharacterized protein (DUF2141 family)